MTDEQEQDLSERLASFEDSNAPTAPRAKARPLAAAIAFIGAIGAAGVVYTVLSTSETEDSLRTAKPEEFQNEGSGFGNLDPGQAPAETLPVSEPTSVPQTPNPELEELRRELAALRQALSGQVEEPENADVLALQQRLLDLEGKSLAAESEAARLRAKAEDRERELQRQIDDQERERRILEAELQQARLGGSNSSTAYSDQNDADADRRAALEAQREAYQARVSSSMIAFGSGSSGSAASGAEQAKLSDDEQFVRDSAQAAAVTRAEVIVNPGNTVTQGTMIQAVLDTALNSTLAGAIRATVTEDVHSYDGSRILIPRGSKLIGKYSEGVQTGQTRVLVAWQRIILPDNQSVQISSFGGDQLGQSGTTGRVNRHNFERFGSAALISIVGVLPALATREIDDEISSELAEDVAEDLRNNTAYAIGEALRIPPTITVAQGTRITVMVDRDIEIF